MIFKRKRPQPDLTIVCIGVSTPPQKPPPPSFLPSPPPPPLKSANCPRPLFLGNPPLYIGFLQPPSLAKNQIFEWTPKIFKSFILKPILSFKSNYILSLNFPVRILRHTEKNIFVCKLFLSLNISDFSLFLMYKLQRPPPPPPTEKSHPLSPSTLCDW